MTVVFTENWTGANGDPWPSTWSLVQDWGGSHQILDNRGEMRVITSGDFRVLTVDNLSLTDIDLTITVRRPQSGFVIPAIYLATDAGATNGYYVELQMGTFGSDEEIWANILDGDTFAEIGTLTQLVTPIANDTDYRIRALKEGTRIRVKGWAASGTEPSTWPIDLTDATYTSGTVGLAIYADDDALSVLWDDLTVNDLSTTTVIFRDDFDRADGALGTDWDSSSWAISSQTATVSTDTSGTLLWTGELTQAQLDAGFYVEAEISKSGANGFGFVSASDGAGSDIFPHHFQTTETRLGEHTSGTYSELDSNTLSIAYSTLHVLRIEVTGAGVATVLVDGVDQNISVDVSSYIRGGKFGLRWYASGTQTYNVSYFEVGTFSTEDALLVPTGLTLTAHASLRQLDGSWTAVTGADSYDAEVDYETDPDTWVSLTTFNQAGTTFTLDDTDGVDWSTTYRTRVRAVTV